MSLILEALKKLDREKQAPDRGVVVVGPAAWSSPGDSRFTTSGAVLVVGALALGGAAGAVWLARRPEPAAAPSQPAARTQSAAPAPAVVPAPPAVAAAPATATRSRAARGTPPAAGVSTEAAPAPARPAEEPADAASLSGETETAAATATGEAPAKKPARRGPAPDFELQAISAQNGQPVAVLNDRLVREGDSFDGVRVLRIGADEVEIEVAGRRRIVKF